MENWNMVEIDIAKRLINYKSLRALTTCLRPDVLEIGFGGCTEERRSWTLPLFFHYIRPETGKPFGLSMPLRSFRLPPAGRFPKERDGKNPVHYQWQNNNF